MKLRGVCVYSSSVRLIGGVSQLRCASACFVENRPVQGFAIRWQELVPHHALVDMFRCASLRWRQPA